MKHTPGPWRISKWDQQNVADGFTTVICDSRGHGICKFLTYGHDKKVKVNANLIATAPDLLEACKEFVRKVECGEARSRRSYAQMKAAINKVEGR